jgi:hypothetical protein
MTAFGARLSDLHGETVTVGPFRFGKQILNALATRAAAATERSRFAALPSRYLDDVGMTEAERAAALGYDESNLEGWRIVASHL